MPKKLLASCGSADLRLERRDALMAAAVMIGGTVLLSALGIVAKRSGHGAVGEAVLATAFPGSLLMTLPFTYLRGKPWGVQVACVAVPMLFVALISLLAHLI